MMWVIGLLTFLLVVDCLFLILLILIQLPKKEAGLGQAFGASTTDALFGAGSGTVLTKLTKYAATVFFVATFMLSILNAAQARQRTVDPRQAIKGGTEEAAAAAKPAAEATPAAAATAPTAAGTSAAPALRLTTTTTNVAPAATGTVPKPATNPASPAAPPAK